MAGTLTSPVLPLTPSLGPQLQVQATFVEQNQKRLILALQSGLKAEVSWALNALGVLSYREKDDSKKEQRPLARVPHLVDALLDVVEENRLLSTQLSSKRQGRANSNGHASSSASREGWHGGASRGRDGAGGRSDVDHRRAVVGPHGDVVEHFWWEEEDLFDLDDVARAEQLQFAIAAANILRNMSFMSENEQALAQHKRCLECLFLWLEGCQSEDEEIITTAAEIISNLASSIDLRVLGAVSETSQPRFPAARALEALRKLLESPVTAWHQHALEAFARFLVVPENEPRLALVSKQLLPRAVDLLGSVDADVQSASISLLYNFAELDIDSKLRIAGETWAIQRLMRIIKAPHPSVETCRRSMLTLESLALEPRNKRFLAAFEHSFAELAMSNTSVADIAARVVLELSTESSDGPMRWRA